MKDYSIIGFSLSWNLMSTCIELILKVLLNHLICLGRKHSLYLDLYFFHQLLLYIFIVLLDAIWCSLSTRWQIDIDRYEVRESLLTTKIAYLVIHTVGILHTWSHRQ